MNLSIYKSIYLNINLSILLVVADNFDVVVVPGHLDLLLRHLLLNSALELHVLALLLDLQTKRLTNIVIQSSISSSNEKNDSSLHYYASKDQIK